MKSYKNSILLLTIIILFSFALSGCWPFRVATENIGRALTEEPKRVYKIKDPVKDSVKLAVLWGGHSTSLVQIYDKVVILDPVFEDIITTVMLRNTECGLDINAVNKLDAILVSHAHMDHLSFYSLDKLADLFPGTPLVFPKGVENYIPSFDLDFTRINTSNSPVSHYIGETKIINGIKITAVFAEHFGGRYGLDSYLWNVPGCTGYIIQYKDVTVFYAGDTSYDSIAFKEIGKKFKIDMALIPVGPCRDCDIEGSFSHIASRGALMVFEDLKADKMIPVHFGAFTYFNDPYYPADELKRISNREDSMLDSILQQRASPEIVRYYRDRVVYLKEGEQYIER
ncbi:hypothetical protein BH10BAC5_BH10BAC5_03540 [soil metagenome]